jgi:hypothetical protein
MRIRPPIEIILLISFILLFSSGTSYALSSIESLKGLRGVEVLVDETGQDLEEFNFTSSQVIGEIVSRLKKAGIDVLSNEENQRLQPLRKPYLAVKISSSRLKQGFAIGIQLGLNQQVIVRGAPEIKKTPFFAPTWYTTFVGAVSLSKVPEIHDVLNRLTDKFISAYLETNPK